MRYTNIGTKHDFLCINMYLSQRLVLKPERVKQVFLTTCRVKDVNVAVKHISSLLLDYS